MIIFSLCKAEFLDSILCLGGDKAFECRDWLLSFLLPCLVKWSFPLKACSTLSISAPPPQIPVLARHLKMGPRFWFLWSQGTCGLDLLQEHLQHVSTLGKWMQLHLRAARTMDGTQVAAGGPSSSTVRLWHSWAPQPQISVPPGKTPPPCWHSASRL